MKIDQDVIDTIMSMVEMSENFKPVVSSVVDTIQEHSKILKPLIDSLIDYTIESKIKTIEAFQNAGFTKQEAILLSIDQSATLSKALTNYGRTVKKG